MTKSNTSASAEPQPRKFADPDTDASKLFQAFHVLASDGKRVNGYRAGDATVSAHVDKKSIVASSMDRVAAFTVTFEIKFERSTVRALLRCTSAPYRDATLTIDTVRDRIPVLIKDADVPSTTLKDALAVVVRACGLELGALSEVPKFSPQSINNFAHGFLRAALQDVDAENYTVAEERSPDDCDDASWKLARRIAVRFFHHISKHVLEIKELNKKLGVVCELPDWNVFGEYFYWNGVRGNELFEGIPMRSTPRGIERFMQACDNAADAIIPGYSKSVFSLVRGEVHLELRGAVHASAEPVTPPQESRSTLSSLRHVLERSPGKKLTIKSKDDVVVMYIPDRKRHTLDSIRVEVSNSKWNKNVLDTAVFNIAHEAEPGIYLWEATRASARRLSGYSDNVRLSETPRAFIARLAADAIEAGEIRYLALCAKSGTPAEAAAEPQTDVKESEFEPRATIFNAFYPLVEMRTKTKSISVKIPSGSVTFKVNPKSIESWHNVDDVSMYEVDGVVSAHGETILLKVRTTKIPHQTTDVIVDTEGERIPVVLRNNEMRLTGNKAADLKAVISLVLRRCGLLEGAKSRLPGEHVEHDTREFVEGFLDALLRDIGDRSHKDYDEDNNEPKLSERFSTNDFDGESIKLVRKIAERFFRHIARARRAYTRSASDVKPEYYGAFFYFQAFGDGVSFGDMPHKSSTEAWDYLVDVCIQASRAIVQGGSVEGADVDLVGRKLHLKFAHGTSIHAAAEPQPGLVKFTEPEDVAEALRKHMRLAAPVQNRFGDLHVQVSPEIGLSVVVSARNGIGVIVRFLDIAVFATRVAGRKPESLLEYVKAAVARLAKYAVEMRKSATLDDAGDFEMRIHHEMQSFPKNEITKANNVSGVYAIPSQVRQRVRGPNNTDALRKWFDSVKKPATAAAEPAVQTQAWSYIILDIPGVGSNTNDTNYQALLDLDELTMRRKAPFFGGVGVSGIPHIARRVLAFRNRSECAHYMRLLYRTAKTSGATDEFLAAFKPSEGLKVHRSAGNEMSTVLGLVHRYGFADAPFVGAAVEPVPKGGSDLSHLFSEAVRKAAAGNLSFSIGEHKVRVVVPAPGRVADTSTHHQPSICFEVRNHIVGKASEVDAQLVRARDAAEVVVHRVSERRREFPRNREIGSLIPSREAAATITHRDLRTDAKPVDLLKRIIDEFKELCALDPIRTASLVEYDVRDEYFDWYAKLTTKYGQVGALVPGFQARRDERHIVLRHASGAPEIAVYPLDGLTGIYEDTETRKLAFKIPLSDLESVSAIKSALASKLQECLAARRAAGNS